MTEKINRSRCRWKWSCHLFFLIGAFLTPSQGRTTDWLDHAVGEIKLEYGLTIMTSEDATDSPWQMSESGWLSFLDSFQIEARAQKLNVNEKRRFFPVEFFLRVFPETQDKSYYSYFRTSRVGWDGNSLWVGHRSSAELISFLIENFPLEGTGQALQLELRNRAVRKAIMDKLGFFQGRDIDVYTCSFSAHRCVIKTENDIAYSTQEQFLQGLVNLEDAVEKGQEYRSRVEITSVPWIFQNEFQRSWDLWSIEDEKKVSRVIKRYMTSMNMNHDK